MIPNPRHRTLIRLRLRSEVPAAPGELFSPRRLGTRGIAGTRHAGLQPSERRGIIACLDVKRLHQTPLLNAVKKRIEIDKVDDLDDIEEANAIVAAIEAS